MSYCKRTFFLLTGLLFSTLLNGCYNSDDLDVLSIKQQFEATFQLSAGKLPVQNLSLLSNKFDNETANLLAINALETSDIADALVVRAKLAMAENLALDSANVVQFGVVRDTFDYLVTSEADSILFSSGGEFELLMNNNSIKEYLFTADSLQFFLIFSLKDTLTSDLFPIVELDIELRN